MNEQQAINLLKKYAPNERIFNFIFEHSKVVQRVALRICDEINDVDREFVKVASLLHDIGRFKCPPGKLGIRHGIVGGEILRNEGLDERFARVCERHIGAGITKMDIVEQNLPLPLKDFMPETKEEKIIAHADNLVFGTREATMEEVIERYKKEINGQYVERIVQSAKEIETFKNKP